MIKNRPTLKDYFKKGAIPTESNFADLIDSMLNQEEDNLSKLPNDALQITASGAEEALLNFYRLDQNQETLTWQVKQKPNGRAGLSFGDSAATRLFIENGTGKLGLGTTAPVANLDVVAEPRSGSHPAAVRWLYVTGGFAAASDGVEFRHTNGSQGIGIGYNTLYATGSNADQDLGLAPRGAGSVVVRGPLKVSGATLQIDGTQKLAFTDGDTSNNLKVQLWSGYGLGINNGTLFYAANGRHSWRDNAGANERMALTTGPDGGLTVTGTGASSFAGSLQLRNSDLYFTRTDHNYTGFGNTDGFAAIENARDYDALMILGRAHNGGVRTVKLWDYLQVNGKLDVEGDVNGNRYIVQDTVDGGPTKGIWMWAATDSNWGIYMGTAGAGKSLAGKTATGGYGFSSHSIRLRTYSDPSNGLIYENNAEQLNFSVNANNGGGYFRGPLYLGNSDVYFTNTEHTHTAFGNAAGYAAIENDSKAYNCLMILGRAGTKVGRNVQVWDYLQVNGTFVNNSDLREKKDIEDLNYGLQDILKLRPVQFNWNDIPNPHKSIGFIAQEVRPVIEEVVYENNGKATDPNLSISYTSLVPVLVNAVKELTARLAELEARANPA